MGRRCIRVNCITVAMLVLGLALPLEQCGIGAKPPTPGRKRTASKPMNSAEFFGPFTSWLNVKSDFGAVGDGKADDTDALQKGFDAIRPPESKWAVLYIPAGTYRITRTLRVIREAHGESQHIIIVGEHPDRTVIRWDGEGGGVMVEYGAWYARMGRITLDGRGKAKTAIYCGPRFATYNEFTDMVFKDVGFGIEAGRMGTQGIAETVVARCQFLRCSQAGVSIQNWNSLDWFIWHCIFEDCNIGVTNAFGAGNYHVYESVFRNSKEADITEGHAAYFSIRNNHSTNSKAFFKAGWLGACGMITIQGNTVVDPKDVAVEVYNLGPLLLFDNVIKTNVEPAVRLRKDAGFVSVGNTFTVKKPIEAKPDALQLQDKVVSHQTLKVSSPELPQIPPLQKRPVIEVPKGSKADDIQQAINKAVAMKEQRPIIHLPIGVYRIDQTLFVPKGCDLCLVGDGGKTVLRWTGKGRGPLLRIIGPSHPALYDFLIDGAGEADGLLIEGCDQIGARIIADQLNITSAREVGLVVNGLRNTDVSLFNLNFAYSKAGIKVVGSGEGRKAGRVVIFSGASADTELSYEVTNGGSLLVRDIWYETRDDPRFALFSDFGNFTMHAARVATPTKPSEIPVVDVNDFRGRVSFLTTNFTCYDSRTKVLVKGDGKQTKVMLLGCGGDAEKDLLVNQSQNAKAASLEAFKIIPGGGWTPIASQGEVTEEFILEMTSQTRKEQPLVLKPLPLSCTDIYLHRLLVTNAKVCVTLR